MQYALMIAIVLHVLSTTFWAGSTFALVRTGATASRQLFAPQLRAAVMAVLTGGYLWGAVHAGRFDATERWLAAGAACAIVAAAVQLFVVGAALRSADAEDSRARITRGHRVAGVLLAGAIVCMAASRYA